MTETPEPAPPPIPALPPAAEAPRSLAALAVFLLLVVGVLAWRADDLTDLLDGPAALTPAQVKVVSPAARQGRRVTVQADEVEGTGVARSTLRILKVGPVPLPAASSGARLALVRSGDAYVAAYVAAGVAPDTLVGSRLLGVVRPWPATVNRPPEVSAWVLDTTDEGPGWGLFVLVGALGLYAAYHLVQGIRQRLARR